MKACTIKVANKGRELVRSEVRGDYWCTVLETTITDDESGHVLNSVISHSTDRDTLTFPVFYDEMRLKGFP